MGKKRALMCLALTAVALGLVGCGVGSGAGLRNETPSQTGTATAPGAEPQCLPAPSALREATVITSGVFRYGSQYESSLPKNRATPYGNLVVFKPSEPHIGIRSAAYAIYGFDSTGYATDNKLRLTWLLPGPSDDDLWIGLANFTRDRWDWYAWPASDALPYDPAGHSLDGAVYAVVLCLGYSTVQLESVRISPGVPPVVLSVSPHRGAEHSQTRFYAEVEGAVENYSWDFGGGATPNESSDATPYVTLGDAGEYVATLTVANAYGQDTLSFDLSVIPPVPWPMFGLNAQHTRCSTLTGPATNELKWSRFLANHIYYSSPAIEWDGTVYVGCYDTKLYAFNPDGSEKWSFPTGREIYSSPAIGSDGTVYFGSADSKIYAVNPDGSLKWSYTTGYVVGADPVLGADGTVYLGSFDGIFYALNPDGSLRWSYDTGAEIQSSAALGFDGTVYVGGYNNAVYAIDPDGALKWSFPTEDGVFSSPAIGVDGTIYVGCFDGNLYAINPDGSRKWAFPVGFTGYASPAIGADGTVYMGSESRYFYAINPDGSLKWTFDVGLSGVASSPAIDAAGTIYIGGVNHNLYAINADGSLKWSFTTSGYVYPSPAIGPDGTLYVASAQGTLYAFGPGSG